jgi:hypothetical protein
MAEPRTQTDTSPRERIVVIGGASYTVRTRDANGRLVEAVQHAGQFDTILLDPEEEMRLDSRSKRRPQRGLLVCRRHRRLVEAAERAAARNRRQAVAAAKRPGT